MVQGISWKNGWTERLNEPGGQEVCSEPAPQKREGINKTQTTIVSRDLLMRERENLMVGESRSYTKNYGQLMAAERGRISLSKV